MDKNLTWVISERVKRTIDNLRRNNISAYNVQTCEQAIEKIMELVKDGSTVSVGGSMTLFDAGIIDHLRSGRYNFLDRYAEGLTPEDIKDIYRKSFSADAYFTSSNAITESGELFNVDGNGNRVAAMIYGPDKVIVIAGVNKIVKDEQQAMERLRSTAAPANARRLSRKTPCAELGYCTNCNRPDRICNDYVLIKKQPANDRMHVIIIDKELGY
ncbi:hypothetical protein EAL2_808p00550 (plasmid) [Peptoclostridium acidaminophilum DSM 3953]|uniref:LUD domain-containing protein n=1 Tax=Peptoclostridium acidaminophilum DSM 3953 TaxID=1286171 RepID=W8TMZ6_PEPAC|nr:lactate utilization protein [Peptoclostridium acidaminophilum]AHM57562.1 hypothetical protein EAL2_808p00550 [Peptoclostridium acidaminophilum DSM 3953]